ncbi:MAG: SPOR domain-containing protein, partial [Cyanobacteria bacterium K_DeepCast_35m_m2_023]|nr:SPOR domain-containing protein [Cyanobacteria bacterium K_DeepCast_35m_m2_023]
MEPILKAKYIIIGMCLFSEAAFSEVIFDVDSVPSHHVGHESIYVQMGSFKNEAFAHHLVRQIRTKNFQNVVIKPTHGELKVLVGPFVNQKELMHFYHVFHGYQSKKVSLVKVEPVKLESVRIQSTPKAPVISSTSSHPWYLN